MSVSGLSGPWGVVLACTALLAAFWIGGEAGLMSAALVLPVAALGVAQIADARARPRKLDDADLAHVKLHDAWEKTHDNGGRSAVFAVHFDKMEAVADKHGPRAAEVVQRRVAERVRGALRADDSVAPVDGGLLIVLAPQPTTDLEGCIQLCARMQQAAEEPIIADGIALWASITVGFCLRSRAPGPDADAWRSAAEAALEEARAIGPGTVRSYSARLNAARDASAALEAEIAEALEAGHVQPWFQPQISTETGRVSGFEALARWVHPTRGVLLSDQFLPTVKAQGLSDRLGEVILYHTLTALKAWDAAGADVPTIGVNFSADELRNPHMAQKLEWELDRFDLAPGRLAIEVAEQTLTQEPDDVIRRNLAALADLGCRIDLDDFGTGSASIAAIRRFRVGRIKLDHAVISKADRDPEQQRLVSAFLTMAERLQVRTLGEGVETVGEHALLAQLGCDDVQGYGIGRPMPFEQTLTWMRAHDAKLQDTPLIGPTGSLGKGP
ncbi:MAG: GGDEF domain-containing phosphodiesterase [Pseudomonadota bacterium]